MKVDEKILVVPREEVFTHGYVSGFLPITSLAPYEKTIKEQGVFLWRSAMEKDPNYKQIIPYLIFKYQNMYFLMQRRSDASEQRLKNKCSLGIGGHLREEDMKEQTIDAWAQREFHEEINYSDKTTVSPLGIINDDSDAVGKVHIGFVYLIEGNSPNISIKSELKNGALMPLADIVKKADNLESWSKLVLPYLQQRELLSPKSPSHATI
jgi:predicted NUDIX family phosphoesterase